MKDDGFKDFVLDQLRDRPGVECRAMFGGFGMYWGDRFFGIVFQGRLYFKVSAKTVAGFQQCGAKPFRPSAKQTLKSFYEVPGEVVEDREQLAAWAGRAIESAADSAAAGKISRGRSRR